MERLSFGEFGPLSDLVDALPALAFIADPEVRILDLNAAASRWLGQSRNDACGKQAGEVLNCEHWGNAPGGCGQSEHCGQCVVRDSIRRATAERRVHGGRTERRLHKNGDAARVYLQVTAAPFEHERRTLAFLLMQDVTELTRLRRLLPVCVNCGSIRNDTAYLESVETYLNEKPELDYAHAICPSCRGKLYPGHDA